MAFVTLKRLAGYAGMAHTAWKLRRSDDELVRDRVRKHLVQRMGKLRGLPQKLGQMLSFTAGDEAAAEEFVTLQDSAEPLPLASIVPVLQQVWQRPLEEVLKEIEPMGHAASLGQVHRAVTVDGREVAIKVQYPGIREGVMADLRMLGWLSVPVGNLKRGFDLAKYRQVILDDLNLELDYRREAETQQQFHAWSQAEPALAVPEVCGDLCTENVLVTHWEEGERWQQVKADWSVSSKKSLARDLARLFFEGLLLRGLVHADLHPGNVRFRRTASGTQLLLYDFGCVYRPEIDQQLALLRLIRATMRREGSPLPLLAALGFQYELLEPLSAKLPALCRVLLEPFCSDYPYDIRQWRLAERVADVLGNDRWNFRIAGPAESVFLLRAFHGLKHYLQGLETPINFSTILMPYLAAYRAQLDSVPLPERVPAADFSTLAQHLKIRVREHGSTKVEITSQASGIDDLEELLDDEVKRRIAARGIDLKTLVADVRRRGYGPGEVFTLDEGAKEIRVWLC